MTVFNKFQYNLLPQAAGQSHLDGIGIDALEFWVPDEARRANLAFELSRNLHHFHRKKLLKMEFSGYHADPMQNVLLQLHLAL